MKILVERCTLLGLVALSCLFVSCLNLELIDSYTEPEGAVIIQFAAHGSGGRPAVGMDSESFTILEDGSPISSFESKQQVVPQEASYELMSLLLLDMSGSILESDNLEPLQDAAKSYVEEMPDWINIGIYRFDGRDSLHRVVGFTSDNAELIDGIESLSTACDEDACDPSTNLHGAIIRGIRKIDDNLPSAGSHRIVQGSMVVFTDGTDRADRVPKSEAIAEVRATEHAVYAIGLGGEIDKPFLKKVGKDGFAFASDIDEIEDAFNDIARTMIDEANSLYTLIYCSPSREGGHTVTLKGTWGTQTGSLKTGFDTDRFDEEKVAYCDPEAIYTGEDVGPGPEDCIEDICSHECAEDLGLGDCYDDLACVTDSSDPECLCECLNSNSCAVMRVCVWNWRGDC